MANVVLESERDRIFQGEDQSLYMHIGYFFTWYNHVEWKITLLMAIVLGEKDFAAFDQLVRGMDARTKVRRLKQLCKIKKQTIEPNFTEQIDYFNDKVCDCRNKLAHRALIRDDDNKRFHFATMERMPWKVLGVSAYKGPPPDHIYSLRLFELGNWMNHWGDDLNEVIDRAMQRQPLGTTNPRALLPEAPPANSPPQDAPPKSDTHDQTQPET